MSNTIGWGKAVENNTIGYGDGKDNSTNGWGSAYENSWSGETLLEVLLTAPVNVSAPVVTGTASVGSVLTTTNGTWDNEPTSYTYQWKRNGSNILSATSSTYTVVAADVSQSITCTVTATNDAGSASATSNTITPTWETDAQAFITAAAITDPTQQSAVNQLVVDLKADGVWSKMKAIYPFVGGSSTSHSFNLRNTSQFQITWNGGITHSSNGVLPNGVNGFGNTGLNLSTQTTLNDIHLGFYSRTHSTQNAADIGAATDNITNYHLMQLTGSTTFYIINESAFTTYPNFSDTDTKGFYVGTRSGTVVKGWKNGTLRATKSPATTAARPNFNVYLGGYNQGGTPALFSNRQLAFSSIGDGLTDTEATNLNTRVTQFQTALNRNV
jgi:hypothetical protein